ncbi:hypothetical protein [Entomomonas asaccharolytica]|uniref:Scaffold protein FimL second domain-containing protein n=1 Tax=Entomomonas asaccharolytica TaxID=2785331 RepID=A0A974NGX0_9GAMM|nr:hypothetical protein [Entomomonas asaccharolytica]QQP86595.1 hypothetical protein JHT90_04985 [Entomomonas asaccharolytica]
MTDLATPTTPKQMKTIITLLNLVKNELFITIDHAERCLEMFISERQSNASLQQFIQALQQIRGSLTLIEISGATTLTDLMLERALAIPTEADGQWDNTLSTLSTAIFTLRRYLENFENYPYPLPELLLPVINELRLTDKKPPLPDSYFADISIIQPPLPNPLPETIDLALFGRLRQMYQIGLLGLIKDENREASLRMMSRSMDRLQKHLDDENAARLCWVTSAAIESFTDSRMTAYPTRKKLFSRVDQQLRKTQINHESINESLLKDLLYIVSLDNAFGIKALTVFGAFNLAPLPYNNKVLEAEMNKLAGPSQSAICSFTAAVREELVQTQYSIDAFTSRSADHQTLTESLLNNLEHLIKTLSLVGLQSAETMLKEQIGILELNKNETDLSPSILDKLADVILHVEGIILNYETTASCDDNEKSMASNPDAVEDTINQYLKQGRSLAIQESLTGIGTAQQNIMGYVESKGDKQYLEKMPQILNEIYGCLLFLNQERAAKIIRQCNYYIDTKMLTTDTLPDTQQLDNLADIFASLEFFMETGTLNSNVVADNKVLDLAEESLATLNVPDIEIPAAPIAPAVTAKKARAIPTLDTVAPEAINNNAKPASLFTDVYDEKAINNNTETLQESKDLDFNLDDFSSFKVDVTASQEEQKTATIGNTDIIKEPTAATPAPTVETTKVEEKTLADISASSKLSLEPIAQTDENKEEKPATKPQSTEKVQSDDDIKFTRPENWTLS